MFCADCALDLVTIEIEDMELEYCARGHGLWVDAAEIVALFGPGVLPRWRKASERRGKRRCPRCTRRMHAARVRDDLVLDVCAHLDGVWFDAGELAQAAQGENDGADMARLSRTATRLRNLMGGEATSGGV